jgi:peptidoglycan/xylan/chitin deacetylase (PgdA/CDA1 family)
MRDVQWRGGARCAASLTFDLDGETLWISNEPANASRPGILSQGAYGPKIGAFLILDLLKRYSLKATFFIPGWVAERYPNTVCRIHQEGHEIGHHGYLHEWPDSSRPDDERENLIRGIDCLRAVTGERPVGYRSPAWELSENSLDLLAEHGFLYSSNLMDDFVPYVHPQGLVELPVQWLLDDAPYFLYRTRSPSRPIWPAHLVLGAWREELHGIYQQGGLFNLTMHPQFIGRPGRVLMLEQLIQTLLTYPDIWIAPLHEIAADWGANHSCEPS